MAEYEDGWITQENIGAIVRDWTDGALGEIMQVHGALILVAWDDGTMTFREDEYLEFAKTREEES